MGRPSGRSAERERERSHGAPPRREGRDKPREGSERGSRERDAREREARGRERRRDRPDRERTDRERSERHERERGERERRGDGRKPERAPAERAHGSEGERRRAWGGERERERRRGSGEGLAPAPARSPARKRPRSEGDTLLRALDSPRRSPLPPRPPPREAPAGAGAARGNGSLPHGGGGPGELPRPPPPPLPARQSPGLDGSPRLERAGGGRLDGGERAEEPARLPLARARAKVGLLRVGGRASEPPSPLGARPGAPAACWPRCAQVAAWAPSAPHHMPHITARSARVRAPGTRCAL